MKKRAHQLQLGQELRAGELVRGASVHIQLPGVPAPVSVRVCEINPFLHTVRFYSPALGWIAVYRYEQQGRVYDEHGHTIHVFQNGKE